MKEKTIELTAPKTYEIDWSKVKTIKDLKAILGELKLTFTDLPGREWSKSGISKYLKEVE
jgi:hypothetical protein